MKAELDLKAETPLKKIAWAKAWPPEEARVSPKTPRMRL
jgi:hypothetical protein